MEIPFSLPPALPLVLTALGVTHLACGDEWAQATLIFPDLSPSSHPRHGAVHIFSPPPAPGGVWVHMGPSPTAPNHVTGSVRGAALSVSVSHPDFSTHGPAVMVLALFLEHLTNPAVSLEHPLSLPPPPSPTSSFQFGRALVSMVASRAHSLLPYPAVFTDASTAGKLTGVGVSSTDLGISRGFAIHTDTSSGEVMAIALAVSLVVQARIPEVAIITDSQAAWDCIAALPHQGPAAHLHTPMYVAVSHLVSSLSQASSPLSLSVFKCESHLATPGNFVADAVASLARGLPYPPCRTGMFSRLWVQRAGPRSPLPGREGARQPAQRRSRGGHCAAPDLRPGP